MNNANTKAWIEKLRDPDLVQAHGRLAQYDDQDGLGYCCLGVGESLIHDPVSGIYGLSFGGQTAICSNEFMTWLGLGSMDENASSIPVIDWPSNVYTPSHVPFCAMTLPMLNDQDRLTLSQIADIIEYFGLRNYYTAGV